MTTGSDSRWSLALAACALVAGGFILLHAQNEAPARVQAQSIAPGGIDRGYVDSAALREPGTEPRVQRRAGRRGRSGADYVPGRLIVKFKSGTLGARSVVETGVRGSSRPPGADFEVLDIDPALDAEAMAEAWQQRDDVEYAQAAYVLKPYFRPNDPLFAQQWNLQVLDMEDAWDINQGASSSVVVAVLDSGLAYQNAIYEFNAAAFTDANNVRYPALGRITVPFAAAPELAGANRFVAPHDFIWDDDVPLDFDGHGTHVAGTIGQLTNNGVGLAGMAFNVRLMPVKVIAGEWDDIFDAPFAGTDDVVARGIRYAADNGAKVINMSIGRDGPPAPVIGDAMRYAVSRGAFIAVAGGNDFERSNPVEVIAQLAGSIDGAVAVAAIGSDLNRAFYSGVRDYIEIAAPGGNARVGGTAGAVLQQSLDSTFTDTFSQPPARYTAPRFDTFAFRPLQGTSMATPHVSGLAALLYSQGITSPAAIEAALKKFATDKGATGRDNEYGYGLINPRATLRGLGLLK